MDKKKYKPEEANLISLELLREFVQSVISPKIFCLNLVLRNKENPNLRLWTLREKLGKSCEEFAKMLDIDVAEYKKYEFQGNKIPDEVINKISRKFNISKKWLMCKVLFFTCYAHPFSDGKEKQPLKAKLVYRIGKLSEKEQLKQERFENVTK